jgi:hypothetical protein
MSTVYVVLGMHRSGTSLVSSMLHRAGLPMCRYRCSKGDKTQPFGYYEDHDFVVINRAILAGARGNWHNPSSIKAIRFAAEELNSDMVNLVQKRADGLVAWGWKDPRTTLTVFAWHACLRRLDFTPRYVLTHRDETGVVESLLRRNRGNPVDWATLYHAYYGRAERFLRSTRAPYVRVDFRELTKGDLAAEAGRLAAFAGLEDQIDVMMDQVHRRD